MFLLKQKSKIIIILTALLLVGGVLFLHKGGLPLAEAQEGPYGYHWAWAETFGWFSLDCDVAHCGSNYYQINIPEEGGEVTGYTWSDYAGWVCFGSTCSVGSPPYSERSAKYEKNASSSEIDGWAKILALPDDEGWLSLRSQSQILPDEIIPAVSFPFCYDCFTDDDAFYCRTCYTDDDWGGSGYICSNCSDCLAATDETSCSDCGWCYQYGIAYRRNVGELTGWAWNGNWQWNDLSLSWVDLGGQPGIGWLNMDPREGWALYPWLETKYGEIYSGENITGRDLPPFNYYNATYCIWANGDITKFVSESGCREPGFEDLGFPKTETGYTNILGKIDLDRILNGYYGPVNSCGGSLPSCLKHKVSSKNYVLNNEVYLFNDSLTNNQIINFENSTNHASYNRGNGLIVVYGNLTIDKENIYYGSGNIDDLRELASVGWLVLKKSDGSGGNIYINPEVTELVGMFYAEGTINTCNSLNPEVDCTEPLTVYGSMLASDFSFNRTYESATGGAEKIIDDGRGLVNPPTGLADLAKTLPWWRPAVP